MKKRPTKVIVPEIANITLARGCMGDNQQSQGKVTQVSCVTRITASSQTLAILRLRLGALWEIDTRKRDRNEISPKTNVTMRADSPNAQTEAPSMLPGPGDSVPAWNIMSDTRLVNCPTISIGADESDFGLAHSLNLVFFLVLTSGLLTWYEESSRLDHLDLGEGPKRVHSKGDILGY